MRGDVIVCLAFVACISATPLTLDRQKDDSKPITIVDVPAGVFETPEEVETKPKVEEIKPDTEPFVDVKQVENVDDDKPLKEGSSGAEGVGIEGPNVFGIRFPSIFIIRRPAAFQDPFAGFQSPFFSRRPIFSPSGFEEREREKEVEPLSGQASGSQDEVKRNETVVMNNAIQRMHQQINNLFANLFNPETFFMPRPRPTYQRPMFTRPSFFAPLPDVGSSEADDDLDFGKLPDNYSNSTSETKIVDGQLVTVNKTVHKVSGNNSNGFFQFSIIKVRPNKPEELPAPTPPSSLSEVPVIGIGSETSESVTPEKKPEPEADPQMNEVDRETEQEKLPEVELNNKYETTNDNGVPEQPKLTAEEEVKIVPIKSAKLIQARGSGTNKISDLSSDIRVNNLMENSAQGRIRALFDPEEVEVFDV